MATEFQYYLHFLNCFGKFLPKEIYKISKNFPALEEILKIKKRDLIPLEIGQEKIDQFFSYRGTARSDSAESRRAQPEKLLKILEKEKIEIVTYKDKNYPKLLREIYDFPALLYVKGNLNREEKYPLAVVGTRKYSNYGKQITFYLVRDLSRAGLTIISGLALGIDGFVHQAVLETKGRTIAVLGGGIDEQNLYPSTHKKLAQEIIEKGGAVVSEYPPGTSVRKEFFPARNRIIAGMGLGTLVIEGPFTSGALITARCALNENREIFAVPGLITSLNSQGTNNLIKKGAHLVTKAEDVLGVFNLELIKEMKEIEPETEEEKTIFKFLSKEPIHIDKLIRLTTFTPPFLMASLTKMELKGMVKNLGGNNYIKS